MEMKHLRWACRRGMLELDSLLVPFFDNHFADLSPQEKKVFEALLNHQDPDLFTWFMGSQEPEDPQIKAMIALIKQHVRT